jgi:hypothetical protein
MPSLMILKLAEFRYKSLVIFDTALTFWVNLRDR